MIWLLLMVALMGGDAQEVIRRPTRRVVTGPTTPTPTPTQTPTATPTPTPTVTPGPCDHCPDPDSFTCAISWAYCVQCWEDCGQPIATPTPTPTRTPPPTPTPVGPECVLLSGGGSVTLMVIYAHEAAEDVRYVYVAGPESVPPGSILRPSEVEGTPIGYEWYVDGVLWKSCGDTDRRHPVIFADGFETGTTERWSDDHN